MIYDVVIVGAGPAALFTAANLQKGLKVLILEKMESPAKKLLISGSGRCNYTHSGDISHFLTKYGNAGNFLKHALYGFTNVDAVDYFKSKGMDSITEESGKIFPAGNAKTILRILENEISKKSFDLKCLTKVDDIQKNDVFEIYADKEIYMAKTLVLATGGRSFPLTGSSGDGYVFAKKFGHTVIDVTPALTPLFSDGFVFSSLSGNSVKNAGIKAKGKKQLFRGELLFTHKGVSGPLVLDASRYFSEGDEISINVTEFSNLEEAFSEVKATFALNSRKDVSNVQFISGVSDAVKDMVLELAGIDFTQKCDSFSDKKIVHLCEVAMNIPFKISSKGGFNIAMVTAGGVNRKEIKSRTMESRITENLFFAGEIIDIDGDTGGYNIQAALSTAFSVSEEINKRII